MLRRLLAVACLGALVALPGCVPSSAPDEAPATDAALEDSDGRATGKAVTATGAAGPAGAPGDPDHGATGGLPLRVTAATPLLLELVPVATEVFTMAVPAGWSWETVGEYTSFGIRAYDPAAPARQVFFYSKMEPLTKSDAARAVVQASAGLIPGDSFAQMYADAPVLAPATAAQFFATFDAYAAYARAYGVRHTFPTLGGLEVLEVVPLQTPIADLTVDDAVVRATFTADGVPAEGLFAASVFDGGPYLVAGVDTAPLAVYNVSGISAPGDEFAQVEAVLAESLASFAFTDAYVQAAQDHVAGETGAMAAHAQTMNAAHASYTAAWAARQPADDALSQQRSDAALGYDRVYDPATGAVYRADVGFYTEYDAERQRYANPALQLVPATDTALWTRPLDGYLSD